MHLAVDLSRPADLHTHLNTNWLLRFIPLRCFAAHTRHARHEPDTFRGERQTSVRIRVLVAEVSGVLRDIIDATLSAQPDIEVLTSGANASAVRVMNVEHPDVVVIGLGESDVPEAIEELFGRHPHARVLGIASDGRHAYMHELRPHRVSLGELSPEQLVQVIRQAGPSARVTDRSRSCD